MGTWLLKLLSRALKNEDQSKNGHKIQQKKNNDRKVKAMGNITPTMDYYPKNG